MSPLFNWTSDDGGLEDFGSNINPDDGYNVPQTGELSFGTPVPVDTSTSPVIVLDRPPSGSVPASSNEYIELKEEIKTLNTTMTDIKEQNRQYYDKDLTVTKEIESGIKQTAEQQRRMASG